MNLLRKKSERGLAAVLVLILVGLGAHEIRAGLHVPRKQAIEEETLRLERRLVELERLGAHSEEIEARFRALERSSGGRADRAEGEPEDLLRRLEQCAKGRVALVKVHPEPPDPETARRRISLEFVDSSHRVDEFLALLVGDLGGTVLALQATVGGRDEIRCQATLDFPHVAPASASGARGVRAAPNGPGSSADQSRGVR